MAELRGYRRVFNKASVVNWRIEQPRNLMESDGARCVSIAFAFPEVSDDRVKAYSTKREGRDFNPVELADVGPVYATVPLHEG